MWRRSDGCRLSYFVCDALTWPSQLINMLHISRREVLVRKEKVEDVMEDRQGRRKAMHDRRRTARCWWERLGSRWKSRDTQVGPILKRRQVGWAQDAKWAVCVFFSHSSSTSSCNARQSTGRRMPHPALQNAEDSQTNGSAAGGLVPLEGEGGPERV